MEGHGVVEVDIPRREPMPGSKYVHGPPCMLLFVVIRFEVVLIIF